MVMEALKILSGNIHKCKTMYLNKQAKVKKRLLVASNLVAPNPKCYVCAQKPEATVHLNVDKITVKMFEEKVLKENFGMVAPDVEIEDGKGTILISSEEGETEENNDKPLSVFKVTNGIRLKVDDFVQNYELVITIRQRDVKDPDQLFIVEGDGKLQASASRTSLRDPDESTSDSLRNDEVTSTPAADRKRKHSIDFESPSSSEKKAKLNGDDDIIFL